MKDLFSVNEPNSEFVLRNSNGDIKPLFNPNVLGDLTGLRIPGVTGQYKNSLLRHNLVTNAGHAAANAKISGQGSYGTFSTIAIGIGATSAATTDTQLGSEITNGGGARSVASATQVTTSVTNDTTQLVKTFTFTSSFAVTEEGILDSTTLSGSTLLAHQVFASINVNSGDMLTITHKYQS